MSNELLLKKIEIKSRDMDRLSEYRRGLLSNPRLTYLFVELTEQCNLNCLHCGSSCNQSKKQYIDTKLLLDAIRKLANDCNPKGVMVCLTGGEPLLHPDFFLIVKEIVDLGFSWGMTTNGTLIDRDMAVKLKTYNLKSVTISIDGLKESHEWLRRVDNCFEASMEAVSFLNEAGILVQITTVVHKKNISELDDMYKLMCGLNIASWRVINLEPIGRANESKDLLLSKEEIIYLLDFIKNKRYDNSCPMDVRFGCSHYLSYEYEHEVRDNYFICGSGIYVGSILCNGDIYSCLDIERRKELVQGNIKTDRFYDVWINRFKEFRADRAKLSEKCSKCSERSFCNGDAAHTWDYDNNEPLLCVKCLLTEGNN
ncbi:MAG: radical SAM protein [Lachnospiraceae bacterium]|nr:radical SAM protein [Lachnospiraceae bacterium]